VAQPSVDFAALERGAFATAAADAMAPGAPRPPPARLAALAAAVVARADARAEEALGYAQTMRLAAALIAAAAERE
jgi:hypothetical protein